MKKFLYLEPQTDRSFFFHAPNYHQAITKLERLKPDWVINPGSVKEVSNHAKRT